MGRVLGSLKRSFDSDVGGSGSGKRSNVSGGGDEGPMDTATARAGGSGGGGASRGGASAEEKSDQPIYKPIEWKASFTIPFNYTTWEEIGTELFCIPTQHSLSAYFTNRLRFLEPYLSDVRFSRFDIETGPVRISNFIVLSDNLTAGNSINEVSSFVQNSKIVMWEPEDSFTGWGYRLYEESADGTLTPIGIPYENICSRQNHGQLRQLVPLTRNAGADSMTESFENVVIIPCQERDVGNSFTIDRSHTNFLTAGSAEAVNRQTTTTGNTGYLYIKEVTGSGVQPIVDQLAATNMKESNNVNNKWIREHSGLKIVDRDDVLSIGTPQYHTYLNSAASNNLASAGKWLFKPFYRFDGSSMNPTTSTAPGVIIGRDGRGEYREALIYAPHARYSEPEKRSDCGQSRDWIQRAWSRAPSNKHTFLSMIPIRKSDGSLMKIRANCKVEQYINITFHYKSENIQGNVTQDINQGEDVYRSPPMRQVSARINPGGSPTGGLLVFNK